MSNISINRRAATRVWEPGGTATCRINGATQRYRIQDASNTGVALRSGPWMRPGSTVDMRLWWPRIGQAEATAVVCRANKLSNSIALRYTKADGVSDLVGDLLTIEELRRTEPVPLFCGNSSAIKLAIDDLHEAGLDFKQVKAPLEAINILQDPWQPVSSIVIAPSLKWLEFSMYIRSEYPSLRRVLLASADSPADLVMAEENDLVDDSLREPWHPNGLYDALGVQLSTTICLCCDRPLATSASPFCTTCMDRSCNLSEQDDLGMGH